jgi:hypothetical protein
VKGGTAAIASRGRVDGVAVASRRVDAIDASLKFRKVQERTPRPHELRQIFISHCLLLRLDLLPLGKAGLDQRVGRLVQDVVDVREERISIFLHK